MFYFYISWIIILSQNVTYTNYSLHDSGHTDFLPFSHSKITLLVNYVLMNEYTLTFLISWLLVVPAGLITLMILADYLREKRI